MNKLKNIVPVNMWMPLILALSCNSLVYFGSRIFTSSRYHYNISNSIDDMVPLVPWTVIIYFGCYIFWALNYVIASRRDSHMAYQIISADFAAKLVCLICFVIFPTTNTRPIIEGTSIWQMGMRFLYSVDAADNLFPSIHCLTSWFCCIAVRRNKAVPIWYRILSIVITAAICVSTLTTKQHVIIDVAAGIALAEISFQLVDRLGFTAVYKRTLEKITGKIFGGLVIEKSE